MSNNSEIIGNIEREIEAKRRDRNIAPTPGPKKELSGTAFGEDKILANSLVQTTNGTGAWNELADLDPDFLNEVLLAVRCF